MAGEGAEDILFDMKLREYMRRIGRKGGKKGGPARARKLTPEERSESARKAARARWGKARKEAKAKREGADHAR